MTVEELIALLEEQNPGAQIRLAWQPSWPMESTLADRVVAHPADPHAPDGLVYLAVEEHLGYLPGPVADEFGWNGVTD